MECGDIIGLFYFDNAHKLVKSLHFSRTVRIISYSLSRSNLSRKSNFLHHFLLQSQTCGTVILRQICAPTSSQPTTCLIGPEMLVALAQGARDLQRITRWEQVIQIYPA